MNIALVLSGGTGTRLASDIPKQYIKAKGRPVISYCLRRLSTHPGIHKIQIAAAPAWQDQIREWLADSDPSKKFQGFSLPGKNRQLSILHGLEDIRRYAGDDSLVLIHDAARPLLSKEQISSCLEAVSGHDGVIPVLPMKDTVYTSTNGKTITSLLDRSQIFAGQAPELFRLGIYLEAKEPAVLAGMDIAMIPGDEGNFKITTKTDLERFLEKIGDPGTSDQCPAVSYPEQR